MSPISGIDVYRQRASELAGVMKENGIRPRLSAGEVMGLAQFFPGSGRAPIGAFDQGTLTRWVPEPYIVDRATDDVLYRLAISANLLYEAVQRGGRMGFLFPKSVIQSDIFQRLRAGEIPDALRPVLPQGLSLAGVPFLAQGESTDSPRWKTAQSAMTVEEAIESGASGLKTNVFLRVPVGGHEYDTYWRELNHANIGWTQERAAEIQSVLGNLGFLFITEALIYSAPYKNWMPPDSHEEPIAYGAMASSLRGSDKTIEDLAEELSASRPADWALMTQFTAWEKSEEKKRVEDSPQFAYAHQEWTSIAAGAWAATKGITLLKLAGPYFVGTEAHRAERGVRAIAAMDYLANLTGGKPIIELTRDRQTDVFMWEFEQWMGRGGIVGGLLGRSLFKSTTHKVGGDTLFYPLGSSEFAEGLSASRANLTDVLGILEQGTSSVWSSYGITSEQADTIISRVVR